MENLVKIIQELHSAGRSGIDLEKKEEAVLQGLRVSENYSDSSKRSNSESHRRDYGQRDETLYFTLWYF